jgi:hypothetical protein
LRRVTYTVTPLITRTARIPAPAALSPLLLPELLLTATGLIVGMGLMSEGEGDDLMAVPPLFLWWRCLCGRWWRLWCDGDGAGVGVAVGVGEGDGDTGGGGGAGLPEKCEWCEAWDKWDA